MRPEILLATVVSSPSIRPLSLIRFFGAGGVRIRKYQTAVPAIERMTNAKIALRNFFDFVEFGMILSPKIYFAFSVQPLCSLCLCGCRNSRYNNHRDTEVAQRKIQVIVGPQPGSAPTEVLRTSPRRFDTGTCCRWRVETPRSPC